MKSKQDHQKYVTSDKAIKYTKALVPQNLPFEAEQMLYVIDSNPGITMHELHFTFEDENKEFKKENGYTNEPFDLVLKSFTQNEALLINNGYIEPGSAQSRTTKESKPREYLRQTNRICKSLLARINARSQVFQPRHIF